MLRNHLIFPILSAAVLAACTPPQKVPSGPTLDLPQNCGADKLQSLIGQPREALSSQEFAAGTRIIGPEDAITADYNGSRLNIELGSDGRVTKVACY